ncbi:unnamed protein product [Adineta steineri]|uniref:Polycystin cation channel PKD1/PKD2 domain-containing protein n=1 Tax=Adineta steineri TaxID=433720 RepID=A0A819JT94_9BILA|nr:unnamed protein product [Adineta steineri]CAF3935598.1 unnamed protein product [Adineta steineri]
MLFEMILMKFNAYELTNVAPILGPICFSLFFLFVVLICMNMFITIISDSFRIVRRGTLHNVESFELSYEQFREKYSNPFEHFPDKIDQLLNAINRVSVIYK